MDGRIAAVYEKIDSLLVRCLNYGKKYFFIVGYDYYGMLAEDLLKRKYCVHEYKIVDDNLSSINDNILSISEAIKQAPDDSVFILTYGDRNEQIRIQSLINKPITIESIFEEAIAIYNDPSIKVGRYSYGPITYEPEAVLTVDSIGSFCSFAIGCRVVPDHPMDMVTTSRVMMCGAENWWPEFSGLKTEESWKKSTIGNDVWFGANVILRAGCSVGNGVIAGAGAVITKDIPDYAIVVGVPARIIKYRFDEEQIKMLLKIKWWDWPISKIIENWDDFRNIELFLSKHKIE